jgi:hypothetical protein
MSIGNSSVYDLIRFPDKNCGRQFLSVGCGSNEIPPRLSQGFALRRCILSPIPFPGQKLEYFTLEILACRRALLADKQPYKSEIGLNGSLRIKDISLVGNV